MCVCVQYVYVYVWTHTTWQKNLTFHMQRAHVFPPHGPIFGMLHLICSSVSFPDNIILGLWNKLVCNFFCHARNDWKQQLIIYLFICSLFETVKQWLDFDIETCTRNSAEGIITILNRKHCNYNCILHIHKWGFKVLKGLYSTKRGVKSNNEGAGMIHCSQRMAAWRGMLYGM